MGFEEDLAEHVSKQHRKSKINNDMCPFEADLATQLSAEIREFLKGKYVDEWKFVALAGEVREGGKPDDDTEFRVKSEDYYVHFDIWCYVAGRFMAVVITPVERHGEWDKDMGELPFHVEAADPQAIEKLCWFVFDTLGKVAKSAGFPSPVINLTSPFATEPQKGEVPTNPAAVNGEQRCQAKPTRTSSEWLS